MRPLLAVLAVLVTVHGSAAPAGAQENRARVRPTGLRFVGGLVVPENADNAFGYGGILDLGSVIQPWLHLSLGASRWSADVDRSGLASSVSGTISDVRLHTDVSVNLFNASGVQPYVGLGLALHNVSADIGADPSLDDALTGSNAGVETMVGVASSAGAFRLSAEARREFVDDVDNWSFMVGIGTRWGNRKDDKPEPVGRADLERLRGEQQEMRRALEALQVSSADAEALRETQEGLLLSLQGSVLFEAGSSRIQPSAAADLARLASVLGRFPGSLVVVEGHPDGAGDPARNVRLSQERADAVAAELRRAGTGSVSAVGYGADRPVASDGSARMEIRVLPRSLASGEAR